MVRPQDQTLRDLLESIEQTLREARDADSCVQHLTGIQFAIVQVQAAMRHIDEASEPNTEKVGCAACGQEYGRSGMGG